MISASLPVGTKPALHRRDLMAIMPYLNRREFDAKPAWEQARQILEEHAPSPESPDLGEAWQAWVFAWALADEVAALLGLKQITVLGQQDGA